jgi:TPR repeat protein
LGAEDGSGAEYLFGEDRSSGHWRLYLALAVLAFTGALLWMQWRHGAINSGYVSGLVKRVQERLETNTASSSSPQTTSPAPAPTPSNQASGPVASNTAPPGPAPAPTQPSAQGGHQPQEKDLPPQGSAEAGSKSQASDKADDDGSDAGEGKDSNGTVSEAKLRNPKAPTAASEPRDTGSDMLLATAQKYLYGQGVPQDCDRAVSYLRQAADGASAKAKSQLGVLYATGHCVPVDRPTAYRWFSRALRQEQNNQYVSHDLQMLWNQMTSEEKQLALRMNR